MAGTWKPYTTTDFGVFLLCFLVVNHPFFCTMKIGYSWLWCLVIMFFIQMPAGDFMVVPVLRRMHISYISYILYTVFIYYIYITIYIYVLCRLCWLYALWLYTLLAYHYSLVESLSMVNISNFWIIINFYLKHIYIYNTYNVSYMEIIIMFPYIYIMSVYMENSPFSDRQPSHISWMATL